MRTTSLCGPLLLLAATSAMAQVQVELRLDKARYLAGEPIVVILDVRNVGDEAVADSGCDGDVRLSIPGAERRVPPNISGCFSAILTGGVIGCGMGHPPMLPPGQTTTFRYLLKEYDLMPGQHELTASGKAGVRWKYYPNSDPNVPPPPPPKHKETDPVPGAQFDRKLSLSIVESTEGELQAALAPLVAAADSLDAQQRSYARAAIIESAPPYLDSLIGRFATEDHLGSPASAIEALGRIATANSRAHLRALYTSSDEVHRSSIVLALARAGHRDDVDFFATVLQDGVVDLGSRRYAALALGRIGGDQAVQYLERALPAAPLEVRPSIAAALGNTRSRAAVPLLIGMFGNNPAQNEVCGALRTLTHQAWCDGTGGDPAATRRKWLRSWNENGQTAPIFGSDNCPADPVVRTTAAPADPGVERLPPSGSPRISSLRPAAVAPNSVLEVLGYELGLEDRKSVRVLFTQDSLERSTTIKGSGGGNRGIEYMDVVVPAELLPGQWYVVVESKERRSAPVAVEITQVPEAELTGIAPPRPHPAQGVFLTTKAPLQIDDQVQLTDARGTQWRMSSGTSSRGIFFVLPDEVADGEASVRVARTQNGVEKFSTPLRFPVTSGPLPLQRLAVALMTPVAPDQWTDLAEIDDVQFEVGRADRIDVEFR